MAIIVLTAGHGGKDPGAVNGSTTEAERMTTLRNATKQALQDLGHTVITDGYGRENLTLAEAVKLIPHFPFMRNTLKYGIINTHHQGAPIYM